MNSSQLRLSVRDREIVQALSVKVRLFSQRQIAGHWWSGDVANARCRLKRLELAGLVARISVSARSLPVIEKPLVSWQPGEQGPDFGAVAYRCQERWRLRHVHPCTAWIATAAGAQHFGGTRRGELKQPMQATHDLGVAAMWLRLKEAAPQWADAWRGEDQLAYTRRGEKLPDAFIVDEQQQVQWVLEFGGGYDAPRVQAFHEDCEGRNLPYQLW